jgi:hypothetical protein
LAENVAVDPSRTLEDPGSFDGGRTVPRPLTPSGLRVPIALKIRNQSVTEMAVCLLSCVEGQVAPRMLTESLTSRPELENSQGHGLATGASNNRSKWPDLLE